MAYRLFDKEGNELIQKNLQIREPWFEIGRASEQVFVDKYGRELGLSINPEKVVNKFTVDLLNLKTQGFGDLKTQHTPFFEALDKYSINPQYAVTFNKKDYLRYIKFYPDIEVYFWVDWIVTKFEKNNKAIEVNPMNGVWKIDLDGIRRLVEAAPLHYYLQRVHDTIGNNKGSYILELNNPLFEKVI